MDIAGIMMVEMTKSIIFACRLLFGLIIPAVIEGIIWLIHLCLPRPSPPSSHDAAEVLRLNPNMLTPHEMDEELTAQELFQGGVVLGQDLKNRSR